MIQGLRQKYKQKCKHEQIQSKWGIALLIVETHIGGIILGKVREILVLMIAGRSQFPIRCACDIAFLHKETFKSRMVVYLWRVIQALRCQYKHKCKYKQIQSKWSITLLMVETRIRSTILGKVKEILDHMCMFKLNSCNSGSHLTHHNAQPLECSLMYSQVKVILVNLSLGKTSRHSKLTQHQTSIRWLQVRFTQLAPMSGQHKTCNNRTLRLYHRVK